MVRMIIPPYYILLVHLRHDRNMLTDNCQSLLYAGSRIFLSEFSLREILA